MFTQFNDDNSGVVVSVGSVSGNSFSGTFTYFSADSQMCYMSIDATQ
jgi:hypothetical protein